jgi:NAD(P)H-hydrate epimerase
LAKNFDKYAKGKFKNVILTPHPKEAARLLGCELKDILNDVKLSAEEISSRYNCVTALKTHKTVVVAPDGRFFENSTGNNSMAKAGSGDVLAGMISGLVAQNMDLFEATALGVYLHGLCGDIAKEKLTEYSVMAEDLISFIPCAINLYSKS